MNRFAYSDEYALTLDQLLLWKQLLFITAPAFKEKALGAGIQLKIHLGRGHHGLLVLVSTPVEISAQSLGLSIEMIG